LPWSAVDMMFFSFCPRLAFLVFSLMFLQNLIASVVNVPKKQLVHARLEV